MLDITSYVSTIFKVPPFKACNLNTNNYTTINIKQTMKSSTNGPQFLLSQGKATCVTAFFSFKVFLNTNKRTYFNSSKVRLPSVPIFPESQHRNIVSMAKHTAQATNKVNLLSSAFLSLVRKLERRAISSFHALAESNKTMSRGDTILPLVDKVNRRLSNQEKRSKIFPTPSSSRPAKQGDSLESTDRVQFPVKRFFYNKKNIATISVLSTRNNTLLTLSGHRGRVLKGGWASAGGLGFKNSRKSTTYAAQAAAKQLALKAKRQGIRAANLKLQGMGRAKGAVVRTLQKSSIKILVIRECTPAVHNGCRRAKKRRI